MYQFKTLFQSLETHTARIASDAELTRYVNDDWEEKHIGLLENASYDGGGGCAYPVRVVTLKREVAFIGVVGQDKMLEGGGERLRLHLASDGKTLKVLARGGYGRDEDGDLIEIEKDYTVMAVSVDEHDLRDLEQGAFLLVVPRAAIDRLEEYREDYPLD
jgi:hypothetical protein